MPAMIRVPYWIGGTAAIFALGLILGGCHRFQTSGPTTAQANKSVTALGRLEPFDGLIEITGSPGDHVKAYQVVEGKPVKPGDPLVILESESYRKSEVCLAEKQYNDSVAIREAVKAEGEARKKAAADRVRRALESADSDIKGLKAKLELVQQQADKAEELYQTLLHLQPGSVSAQDISQQESRSRTARVELLSTQLALDKAERARKDIEAEASLQQETAEASLRRAILEVPVETAQRGLQLARERYQASQVKAPSAATVIDLTMRPGESITTRPLLRLGDTSRLAVIAEVDEVDVLRVQIGQRAHIASTVFVPLKLEQPLSGTVVAPLGRSIARHSVYDLNPAAASDRRVVNVKIELNLKDLTEQQRQELQRLINLTVNVEIFLDPTSSN